MDDEKFICHQCVRESYVSKIIQQEGNADQNCSYCGEKNKNITLDEIAKKMDWVFDHYFEPYKDTGYYSSSRGGDPAEDVIMAQLKVVERVAEDILEILIEKSSNHYDDIDNDYEEDYVYRPRNFFSNPHELNYAWEEMKKSLQGEARFFNRKVKIFLDDLFSDIETSQTNKKQSAITLMGKDTVLYRARSFETLEDVEKALEHPERHFGPPPQALARSGRMNAQGIPVFYGTTLPAIAVSEIRPSVGNFVVVTPFRPLRPLQILDITALDALSYKEGSRFDTKIYEINKKTLFLKTLSQKLTLPVSGKNADSEYLITQAVSEYLAVSERYNLDGLSFESTQVREEDQNKIKPHNIVLFSKSARVKDADANSNYIVELFENIQDDEYSWNPTIRKIEDGNKSIISNSEFWDSTPRESLEIIPDKIVFYKIEGVIFQSNETEITLGETIITNKTKNQRT